MMVRKLASLFLFILFPLVSAQAAERHEAPVEIMVVGRQPGPPLWKVSNGDKVMWIFPYLNWIPKDMLWESDRVARVINESQEFLSLYEWQWVPPTSVRLNPINMLRNNRNGQRNQVIPDGGTLNDVLPADLYARFAALQTQYFPGNKGIVEMRPLFAGRTMMNTIQKQEGLVAGDDILKTIKRLVRSDSDIKRTEITERLELGASFAEYTERLNAVYESFPPEQEQACFEEQLRHMEEDISEIKIGANNWAQGKVDELHYLPLVFGEREICNDLFMGSSSPEHDALRDMQLHLNQMWLDAADKALTTNASTFAIMPINDLLSDDGLLSKLKAKGYEVREP